MGKSGDKKRTVSTQEKANCQKKKRYDSAFAAKFFGGSDGLRPYPCPVCKGFHLTSKRVDRAKKFRVFK